MVVRTVVYYNFDDMFGISSTMYISSCTYYPLHKYYQYQINRIIKSQNLERSTTDGSYSPLENEFQKRRKRQSKLMNARMNSQFF